MKKSSTPVHRDIGFTLTELLVVIGVIAVLIGLLMPALARARRNAMQLKCAANLHTLGQLLVVSANDHGGYMPLAGNIVPGPGVSGDDSPQGLNDAARQRYTYYTNDADHAYVTALPAALAPYITGSPVRSDSWENVDADLQAPGPLTNAFTCPSDQSTIDRSYVAPKWINNNGSFTFLNGFSSYGINAEVFAWTDNGTGGTDGHSRCRGKLSLVPHPSETMLMCDSYQAIEIWVLGPQLSLGDVYLNTGGTVGSTVFDLPRHHGRMNVLYADGHVDTPPILSTGKTSPSGDIGSTGNQPSGSLMDISMDKNFR